jgi:hypothetical protein
MRKQKFHQGKFVPKFPSKYIGNVNNIVFRSGLEYHFFKFFDENPSITNWGSEEIVIPYFLNLIENHIVIFQIYLSFIKQKMINYKRPSVK